MKKKILKKKPQPWVMVVLRSDRELGQVVTDPRSTVENEIIFELWIFKEQRYSCIFINLMGVRILDSHGKKK
jgi:hypothetical protein